MTTTISNSNPSHQILEMIEPYIEVFCTPSKEPYATISNGPRKESYPIDSPQMQNHIFTSLFRDGIFLPENRIEELTRYFKGKAFTSGQIKQVYKRVAPVEGGFEIDLNDPHGRCVLVSAGSWEIVEPTTRFIRTASMATLPLPAQGRAGMKTFGKYFRTTNEDDLKIMVAFCLSSFWPTGPYPILSLKGPQGSGKSMTMELIKTLIDPVHQGARRSEPKNEQNLFVAANQNHLLALDNLSSISR